MQLTGLHVTYDQFHALGRATFGTTVTVRSGYKGCCVSRHSKHRPAGKIIKSTREGCGMYGSNVQLQPSVEFIIRQRLSCT
jgi:hypothetical protein